MQYECKITVLDTKVFPELQEKYLANPKSGKCPFFRLGSFTAAAEVAAGIVISSEEAASP